MAGISSDKPVEEEQVQTEEADPAKTTDEEVQTEEADPAKTTDEEKRAEKATTLKTVEEEEVQTEEAIGRVLDFDLNNPIPEFDLNNPVLDHNIEDKAEGNENENPQEDSTMISRSNQTRKRGLTSVASDENRRLAPQNRFGAQMSQVMRPPQENVRLSGSLVTQPPYQNPRLNQIPPRGQMMNQQQPFSITSAAYFQNVFYHANGMQQRRFPSEILTQRSWIITDLNFAPGLVPNPAWRPQFIRPLMQSENAYQRHPMVNQLASIVGLQNQMLFPLPLFAAAQISLVQQPHLSAVAFYPYMRPEENHQNRRMPPFGSGQMLTLISPNGQPRSFVVMPDITDPQRRHVFSLYDAVVAVPLSELNHQQMQQRQPQAQQPTQSQRFNAGPFSHQNQDQQQQP